MNDDEVKCKRMSAVDHARMPLYFILKSNWGFALPLPPPFQTLSLIKTPVIIISVFCYDDEEPGRVENQ